MLFISDAYAQAAAPQQPSGASQIFMLLIIFGIMWFFMIRPQQKRAKETREMQSALKKGDEVLTSGGIMGRIINLNEYAVEIEIAKNVSVRVQRPFVASVLPQGTLKAEWDKVSESLDNAEDKPSSGGKKSKKKKGKTELVKEEVKQEVKEEIKEEIKEEEVKESSESVEKIAEELNSNLDKIADKEGNK